MASYEDAAFGCFVGIASAHDVNAHGRLAIRSVVNALQPMIKPSEVKRCEIERRVVGELRLPGVTEVFTAVDPRADDQALETLLGPAQFDEVYVRNLRSQESYQPVVWYSGTSLYSARWSTTLAPEFFQKSS